MKDILGGMVIIDPPDVDIQVGTKEDLLSANGGRIPVYMNPSKCTVVAKGTLLGFMVYLMHTEDNKFFMFRVDRFSGQCCTLPLLPGEVMTHYRCLDVHTKKAVEFQDVLAAYQKYVDERKAAKSPLAATQN